MYKNCLKRVLDFVISLFAIIVLSPFLLVVIIAIKIDSKGPVFFLQPRMGRNHRAFSLYKFRTMTDKKRDPMKEQTYMDNPEITHVGHFLRRCKIDELPQLINVLKGDMALIGPRPALPELYDQFGEEAQKRLRVRPGLSGLSQTRGNIFLTWEKRFEYDNEYIDNLSFWVDVKIVMKTFLIIIWGEEKFIRK
jgi:lipopolysaccharide/colanic/teichoic acid biosynthesis glycosyltransferase